MSASILNFSTLETLELTTDPEFDFTPFQKLAPLKVGTLVDGLALTRISAPGHRFFDEIVLNAGASAFRYSHKPLLLYFFEKDWGAAAQGHLRQLNDIHAELCANNINLLVITAKSLDKFRELSWKEALALEVFEDADNELARQLRLYSEKGPTWGSYSGIDNNVALPALYLLDSARRVALDFPNENIQPQLPLQSIIPVLQRDTEYWLERKSA